MTKPIKQNVIVTLEAPVIRGEQTIETIELRRPQAGELRGLSLIDLIQMDVSAIIKLVPRISSPSLLEQEVSALEPQDLVSIAAEISLFLAPKSLQEAAYQST